MDAGQAPATGGQDDGFKCTCTKETWPTVLFGLGLGANVLVCIVAVTNIIGGDTATLVLDCFLFVFGLIGCAAELRMFSSLRGIMFYIVKHVYFVARPCGRGVFYLFVASLTWTPDFKILTLLTAILLAVVAVLTIGVDLTVGLPCYIDKEIQQTLNQAVRAGVTEIAVDHAKNEARREVAAAGSRI